MVAPYSSNKSESAIEPRKMAELQRARGYCNEKYFTKILSALAVTWGLFRGLETIYSARRQRFTSDVTDRNIEFLFISGLGLFFVNKATNACIEDSTKK